MIRWLLGLSGPVDGGVCPGCGRYDWPEQPDVPEPCGCGGHVTRECADPGCGFAVTVPEPGPDCG